MIYDLPGSDALLDQGDLIDNCLILSIREFNLDSEEPPRINVAINRVLVLTQTCDLANRKATNATVAVVHEAQFIVDQGLLKPADVRGPVRAARVYGWYFLPADSNLWRPSCSTGSTSARWSSEEPPERLQTKLRKCGKHRADIKAGLRDPYCLLLIVTPGQSSVRNGVAGNPTPL